MKKTKIILIVLAILFVVSGISYLSTNAAVGLLTSAIGIVLGVVAFLKSKKEKSAGVKSGSSLSTPPAPASAPVQENPNKIHYTFHVICVAGVTFKNEDGKSRQTLLRKIKFQDPPFDGELRLEVREHEFEGEFALGVFVNGQQIGNVPKDDLHFFQENTDMIDTLTGFEVVGGGKDQQGNALSYGARFRLRLYATAEERAKA